MNKPSLDPTAASVSASTPWSEFVSAVPDSILIRKNKQVFGKKPWHNVQPSTPAK